MSANLCVAVVMSMQSVCTWRIYEVYTVLVQLGNPCIAQMLFDRVILSCPMSLLYCTVKDSPEYVVGRYIGKRMWAVFPGPAQ
jgi:hypothetical protein